MKTFVKNRYCEETNRFLVGRRGYLIHPPRHCEERSDVAISFFCFFLYKNLKMRSSRWKAPLRMTNERHPPRRKTAPLQGGELLYYSPIEGGFKGGVCLFLICLITFHLFRYFQDRRIYPQQPRICIPAI